MLDTKEIIKKVKKIEISTKLLADGVISGSYLSVFKGQGLEFSEIRDYREGDDVRAIDWKVTARFNKPFVKEFIEERDLRVYFAFDYSASGFFGNVVEKRRKSIEMTATLMFSALRNNDNVGLFIFTESVERFFPARKGRKHVLKLISNLVNHTPQSKKTDLNNSLRHIANVLKKRSILFIISDFYSADFQKPLSALKTKHDVVALRVIDPREKAFPDVGLIMLEDEETGEQVLVESSDERFRKRFAEVMAEEERRLERLFRRYKVDAINIFSDESFELPLRKFFKVRQKR